MTVAVQQDPRRTWREGQRCRRLVQVLLEELLEEERGAGHVAGAALGVAAEEIRRVFADGRQTARLEKNEACALRSERKQPVHILGRTLAGVVEQTLRDQ